MPEHKNERPGDGLALRSLGRGLLGRCPNCGKGKMFSGFLVLSDKCEICGEDVSQMDPSLLLPLVVGLFIVTIVAHVYFALEIMGVGSPIVYLSAIVPVSIVASFLVMRPIKGALVGLTWALQTGGSRRK